MDTSILNELGLTNTEIKVYLALLKLGQSSAPNISREANVERAVTYHILEKLVRKGIVSYINKENKRFFSASEPNKLGDLLKEKEEALNVLIPDLNSLRQTSSPDLKVEVFSGKEGLKTVLNDFISEKKDYYIIGYTGRSPETLGFWFEHWNKRRIKNKVKRYILLREGDKESPALHAHLTYLKVLSDKSLERSTNSIVIYGSNKVVLFLPLKEFACIRITNKEVHKSYKEYFDLLWKESKPLK